MSYPRRSRKRVTYHGRSGFPVLHITKGGRLYIMVRKRGGGVRRLYDGSRYSPNGKVEILNLKGV